MERLVIEATEAAPLRPHEVQAIVERAEGNPLFVEEITRVARTAGTQGTMPDSLQAAMAAQIDLLEPTERRILRTAAVLGRSFRREVLRETLSADGLTRDPGRLTQLSDFLEADGPDRLRFRNSLVRDAAYEELAYKTRARLHRAAGLATERLSADLVSDAPTLSLHFSRAGRRRAHVDLRAHGGRVGASCLRQRRRGRAVRAGPRRGQAARRAGGGRRSRCGHARRAARAGGNA